MTAIFSFKCSQCDELHEGSPSFGFNAPAPYLEQPEYVQKAGELGSDLCHYNDEEGGQYFVRAVLEIPIHEVAEPFTWGVWVSVSEESFERYLDTYDEPSLDDRYFGWLCNYLPFYESTHEIETSVRPRDNGMRPSIELSSGKHALQRDFHNGISTQRAQEIAEHCMHTASKV